MKMTLFSFVNGIVMTVILLAVLLYGTFRGRVLQLYLVKVGTRQHTSKGPINETN